MKKIFSLLLTMTMLVSMFTFAASANELGTIEFYNAADNSAVTRLDNVDNVYANVSFIANETGVANVMAAHYDIKTGALTAMELINSVETTAGAVVQYNTPEIAVADTDLLKVFAWDADSLAPLATAGSIDRLLLEELPTASVTELDVAELPVDLTFALNFKADAVTEEQLEYYGEWYADYEITVNKTATFNGNGTADGYLAGQYDSWSANWVVVPNKDLSITAGTPVRIMETAAEVYGKAGLKYTYQEVYDRVKDFDCGIGFSPEFLAANDGLEVTVCLKMYNPANEAESFVIGDTYTYTWKLPTASVTELDVTELPVELDFALNFKADSITEEQLALFSDWYADYEITVNKTATLNANGTADAYLAGQYDSWSANWVSVPTVDAILEANTPVRVMSSAAELMGKPGLKMTFKEIYTTVKDFDCGIHFSPAFLAANDGLEVTLCLKMYNPANEAEFYVIGDTYTYTWKLPTASVTELDVEAIEDVDLDFGLNFKADAVTEEQLAMFSDWYADYELTLNKTATFNANGTADAYLAGQYDSWSANWVVVPNKDLSLAANSPVKIMETAAEVYGKAGLKYTYEEVYTRVKDFDCGLAFSPAFLVANPDLEASLVLKIYNPANENESYIIGGPYTYTPDSIPSIDKFIAKEGVSYTHTLETAEAATATFAFEDLFTVIGGVPVDMDNLTVTGATYADGKITVEGFGAIEISVTDNYYCNVATATVIVNSPAYVDKFDGKDVTYTHTLDTIDSNTVTYDFSELFTNNGYAVKDITVTGADYKDGKITVTGLGKHTITATDNYYCNVATATVTVVAPEAVDKFTGNTVTKQLVYGEDTVTVAFDELFTNNGYAVKELTVGGDGVYENGVVTFTGAGTYTVTVTDNFYCNVATATVIVEEPEIVPEVKFDKKFTKDFLYRVGNANAVSLGTLFAGAETVDSASVDVTYTVVDGDVTMAYTKNASNWENATVKFGGTGIVTVTITDGEWCIPTELTVEIVTATNLTSAQGTTTGENFVLVKDINSSTYRNYWGGTLYGNGFTYTLNGAPTDHDSKQGHGILIVNNAVLDNLVIIGEVYDSYGAYSTQSHYNAVIDAQNGTVIQNCYIANCSAPVSVRGNAKITNTTLYGGTVANLIIKDGVVTLENVTTANYDDGRSLVGMGIIAHPDATDNAKLIVNGTLKQYNYMSETKKPSDTFAQQIYSTMFGSSLKAYQFGTSPNRYVNTGIVSLTDAFTLSDLTDNANTGYESTSVTLGGKSGFVYSQKNTWGSVDNSYSTDADAHYATTQGAVAPTYTFDYTTKNFVAKTEGSNDYCYEESGVVNMAMDAGDVFNWDTSILTATKNGHTLAYTVSMNGTDYTGKTIPFSVAGDYEVVYQYTDPYNTKLDANGNLVSYEAIYTKTVHISVSVVAKAAKSAEFTFGSSNTASKTVTVGSTTYVMPNVSATSSTIGSKSVSGTTVYYPIVEIIMSDGKTSHSSGWYAYFPVLSGVVTITDYKDGGSGDPVTYNGSTTTMPAGLSLVGDATQLFKYQSSSNAGASPVVKSNKLVYSSAKIEAKREDYTQIVEYTYKDNKGDIYHYFVGYHAPAQSYSNTCFTEDTLITLGDGSVKAIKDITKEDVILSYNFFTGEYEATDVALLVSHGVDTHAVANLTFSDGTTLRIIGEHGVFDYDANEYAYLTVDNMADYIGHTFVKQGENGAYELVTLESAYQTEETIGAYSLTSAGNANAFAEGMLTMAPPGDFYNWIGMGDKLRYDLETFANDIETYGLYTFEDFGGLVTYEQFVELNGAYLKIPVEKGIFTWDYIVELIGLYVNP